MEEYWSTSGSMDSARYLDSQKEAQAEHEALCRRCGLCCGLYDNDPCRQLVKTGDGKYSCRVYEQRLGVQYTVSGKLFHCVPIRDFLNGERSFNCAYSCAGALSLPLGSRG